MHSICNAIKISLSMGMEHTYNTEKIQRSECLTFIERLQLDGMQNEIHCILSNFSTIK